MKLEAGKFRAQGHAGIRSRHALGIDATRIANAGAAETEQANRNQSQQHQEGYRHDQREAGLCLEA